MDGFYLAETDQEPHRSICTLDAEINQVLGHKCGLVRGTVTEIVGASGAGKSQLCMQLTALALASSSGTVVYVDSERCFKTHRVLDMMPCGSQSEVDCNVLDNVLCYSCVDVAQLLAALRQVHGAIQEQRTPFSNTCLVVVDSIAQVLRGYEGEEYRQYIHEVGVLLSMIAGLGPPVLITNHVVDVVEDGKSVRRAALSRVWNHRVTCRVWIERDSEESTERRLMLTKSPFVADIEVLAVITKTGFQSVTGDVGSHGETT